MLATLSVRGGFFALLVALLPLVESQAPPAEWTLERARKEWKPMTRGVQHVGVPGHEWQTAVLWNGSLFFGPEEGLRKAAAMKEEAASLGNNLLHLSVGYGREITFPDRLGNGSPQIRHSLEMGYLPIPRIQTQRDGLAWDQTVFARLLGKDMNQGMQPAPDDVLVTFVKFRATNSSAGARTGHLWLHFGETSQITFGYKFGQGAALAPALEHTFAAPYGMFDGGVRYVIPEPAVGKLIWHDATPVPGGERMIEWSVMVPGRTTAELLLIIPHRSISRERAAALTQARFDELLADTRRFWQQQAAGAAQIVTGDSFVNDICALSPDR
jgi:hypothetical protein